ncbi:MAG TPA: ABC transporter ATP-binding protein [Chloroflexia bacterium]|nr:ABC transporter ATP-binding protein [Chloroflexia bacterium]
MMADGDYVVEASGLVKHFGDVRALDGLDVGIRKGESFGLLGPNGSGKTTFIRMVAGLVRPTSGDLRVLGHSIPSEAVKVRPRIGYMTQLQALYTDLSVWENVQFFARIFGIKDAAQRDARITEVLTLVELLPRKGALVSELSGGMKQRLSLACALVHDPQLLLLDEPTVGVDPQLRQTFWGYFRQLNERGVTILVSSHVMDEADRCDRLGLVRAGKVLAVGTPGELRRMGGSDNLESAFLALASRTTDDGRRTIDDRR